LRKIFYVEIRARDDKNHIHFYDIKDVDLDSIIFKEDKSLTKHTTFFTDTTGSAQNVIFNSGIEQKKKARKKKP